MPSSSALDLGLPEALRSITFTILTLVSKVEAARVYVHKRVLLILPTAGETGNWTSWARLAVYIDA